MSGTDLPTQEISDKLSWSHQQAVDELAGALTSVAALLAFLPALAGQVRAAVIDQLGDYERKLIVALNWEMVRRNVAEMHAEERAQEASLERVEPSDD